FDLITLVWMWKVPSGVFEVGVKVACVGESKTIRFIAELDRNIYCLSAIHVDIKSCAGTVPVPKQMVAGQNQLEQRRRQRTSVSGHFEVIRGSYYDRADKTTIAIGTQVKDLARIVEGFLARSCSRATQT